MIITVFSKSATSKDGKKYSIYLGRLVNKATGEEVPVRIKFRESCGAPKDFPCNIVVDKQNANMVRTSYVVEETGEERVSRVLWVNRWSDGEPYVDHSLDDYD